MSWRDLFLIHFGTGILGGIRFGDWLRLLRENRFAIDAPYWPRAASITMCSLVNSLLGRLENRIHGQRICETQVEPPLFILGIWRSGTTLLHNLFAVDDRFVCPNLYQVLNPHAFLCTESTSPLFLGQFVPRSRPQDSIDLNLRIPAEDEIALCVSTFRSMILSWVFPRRSDFYDRYLTMQEVPENEVEEWKDALLMFVRKLTYKTGRRVVLKSPAHTSRIELLRQTFPGAKFIHIHRNPFDVFRSARHTALKVIPYWALQRPNHDRLDDRIIHQHKEVFEAFFEQRDSIPQGHFHEIRFEELEKDPIGQVRKIYDVLDLDDFGKVEPSLRKYVDSLSGYTKNKFPELPQDLRKKISREWRRCFEEWGYAD